MKQLLIILKFCLNIFFSILLLSSVYVAYTSNPSFVEHLEFIRIEMTSQKNYKDPIAGAFVGLLKNFLDPLFDIALSNLQYENYLLFSFTKDDKEYITFGMFSMIWLTKSTNKQ